MYRILLGLIPFLLPANGQSVQEAPSPEAAIHAALQSFARGEFEETERTCAALLKQTLGPAQEIKTLSLLARTLASQAKYSEAEDRLVRAIELAEASGVAPPARASLRMTLATVRAECGRAEGALKLAQEAIRDIEGFEADPELPYAWNSLGMIQRAAGRPDWAMGSYDRALEAATRLFGPESQQTIAVWNNQVDLLIELGQAARAHDLCLQVLAVRERRLGPDHPDTAVALHNCGMAAVKLNRPESAEELFARALGVIQKRRGPSHPSVAATLDGLAEVRNFQARYAEAAELHSRALRIRIAAFGERHPAVGTSLIKVGAMEMAAGRCRSGVDMLERAYRILHGLPGPENIDLLQATNGMGVAMFRLGRYDEAQRYHREALRIAGAVFGPTHPATLKMQRAVGLDYEIRGLLLEAESLYSRTLRIQERSHSPDVETAWTLAYLARVCLRLGERERSDRLALRMVEVMGRAVPPGHPDLGLALTLRAGLLAAQNRFREAADAYERAAAILAKALGENHISYAETVADFGRVKAKLKQYREAERLLSLAAAIEERELPPDHPTLRSTWVDAAWVLRKLNRKPEADALRARAAGSASSLR